MRLPEAFHFQLQLSFGSGQSRLSRNRSHFQNSPEPLLEASSPSGLCATSEARGLRVSTRSGKSLALHCGAATEVLATAL